MSSNSLFLAAPLKLHLPQNALFRSSSPRITTVPVPQNALFRLRSPHIAVVPVFSSPSSLKAQPYFTSSASFNSFSPVSSAPQMPATDMSVVESNVKGLHRLLLREGMIFLAGRIDDFVAYAIISQLILLEAEDHTKDIRLFINSLGGSLRAALAIFDTNRFLRADVSTIAIGFVAPPASIILYAGAKGKRLSTAKTKMLIGSIGGATDVGIYAKKIIRIVGNDKYHEQVNDGQCHL